MSIANEQKGEKEKKSRKKREKARKGKHECKGMPPKFSIFRRFAFATIKGKYKEMMQKG